MFYHFCNPYLKSPADLNGAISIGKYCETGLGS